MPDDVKPVSDYDRDYYTWALTQAEALRAVRDAVTQGRRNDWEDRLVALDWENLAEEIEALGRRDRRELGSRIGTIIEHLVKLEFSPARDPRAGWEDSIERARRAVEVILRESPSLRREFPAIVEDELEAAARMARRSLARHGENVVVEASQWPERRYTPSEILDDWWPETTADKVTRA